MQDKYKIFTKRVKIIQNKLYGKCVSTNRLFYHKLKKIQYRNFFLEYTETFQIKNEIFNNINGKD